MSTGIGYPKDKNNRIKILVVVSHLAPTYGLEKLAIRLINDLNAVHDVRIMSLGDVGVVDLPDVPVQVVGKSRRGISRLLGLSSLFIKANSHPEEVVILVGLWVAVPWLAVRFRASQHTIIWEHSLLSEKFSFDRRMALLSRVARLLYNRAACVVAVSEPQARDLIGQNYLRTVSINNPVEPAVVNLKNMPRGRFDSQNIRIISIGSLNTVKRQKLVILAMKYLPKTAELTIVGDGPMRDSLEDLVRSEELQDSVRFTGFLDPASVNQLLSESDCLVHASISETFGLVLVEAAELNIPVIATRSLVSEYLVDRYVPGLVVENSETSIANGILSLSKSKISKLDLDNARNRRSLEFAESQFSDKWRSLIHEIQLR